MSDKKKNANDIESQLANFIFIIPSTQLHHPD